MTCNFYLPSSAQSCKRQVLRLAWRRKRDKRFIIRTKWKIKHLKNWLKKIRYVTKRQISSNKTRTTHVYFFSEGWKTKGTNLCKNHLVTSAFPHMVTNNKPEQIWENVTFFRTTIKTQIQTQLIIGFWRYVSGFPPKTACKIILSEVILYRVICSKNTDV